MHAKKQPAIKPFLVKRGAILYFYVSDEMPAERAKVVSIPRDDWATIEWLNENDQCVGRKTVPHHQLFQTHTDALNHYKNRK